jgi:hypothetical protein
MPDTIPNLWASDISVDVVPPVAILQMQAGILKRMTKGLLEGEVSTTYGNNDRVQHQLDVIAPALGYYRHRLLSATHDRELVYPVTVEAECFLPAGIDAVLPALKANDLLQGVDKSKPKAATQEEFLDLVGKVLRSQQVKSLIQSLIARINEQRPPSDKSPATGDQQETA